MFAAEPIKLVWKGVAMSLAKFTTISVRQCVEVLLLDGYRGAIGSPKYANVHSARAITMDRIRAFCLHPSFFFLRLSNQLETNSKYQRSMVTKAQG